MPKQVDHQQRRHQISEAAARIATTRGLQSVSFREVAGEAGVSVSLVQHYFGSKDRLMIDTLDIQSARLGAKIVDRLEALGPDARPLQRLRAITTAFLPEDDEGRNAMLLYLGFAGAALTDPSLRRADAFHNANTLIDAVAVQLSQASKSGELTQGVEPGTEARAIVSLVLGLSLAVLLEQASPRQAVEALDSHLSLLGR